MDGYAAMPSFPIAKTPLQLHHISPRQCDAGVQGGEGDCDMQKPLDRWWFFAPMEASTIGS